MTIDLRELTAEDHRIRVILPTGQGVRSVRVRDLMPLGAVWTVEEGTQPYDVLLVQALRPAP
jgi:hypothetical protein